MKPRPHSLHATRLVAAIALAGVACDNPATAPAGDLAGPPLFLSGGQSDFTHLNVGAVVTELPFVPGNPRRPICTGTLIAPTVVVTAGHCAFIIKARALPVWFTFDQQFSASSPLIPATAIPHPDFAPSRNPNDIGGIGGDPFELGVLILVEEVTDRTPAKLPRAGLLDELKQQKMLHPGDGFTLVGYGLVGFVNGMGFGGGQRRSAEVPYSSLKDEAVNFSAPNAAASACTGDSGGPYFLALGGEDVLTSVLWWLGPGPLSANGQVNAVQCSGWHRGYRLDTPQARSFLGNYVDLP